MQAQQELQQAQGSQLHWGAREDCSGAPFDAGNARALFADDTTPLARWHGYNLVKEFSSSLSSLMEYALVNYISRSVLYVK